ncbi:MAG TPA: MJ0042-type zinc finger domain-containing protein, partial [Gemmataceae bacterium]|nr:MJ0042-type zinc finger domain-containing protein [Gemmataceae bacterium]
MSLTAQCSECGSEYRLREEFEGKKVRCKKCGAEFKVAAEAEQRVVAVAAHQDDEDDSQAATERPRKRPKKDGDGDRPRRKKVAKEKGFRTVAGFVALIGLAVAVLVGLGFLFYF